MAMPIVAPRNRPIPVSVVITRFSLVTKKTMYADSQVNGVCRAMEMMVTTTTPSTSRRVMVARPGNGDSSHQSHCRESTGANRENRGELRKGRPAIPGWVKLLILRYLCLLLFNSFDHSHRRSPHAEQFRVRVFNFNAHGESLRDVNPVQLALHVRQTVRNIDLVGWLDRPADSVHLSSKLAIWRSGQIDIYRRTRREVAN